MFRLDLSERCFNSTLQAESGSLDRKIVKINGETDRLDSKNEQFDQLICSNCFESSTSLKNTDELRRIEL